MKKKQKKMLGRILLGTPPFILAILLPLENQSIKLILYLLAYFILSSNILLKAFRNIGYGQIFDENLLMILATISAFSIGEYPEGVTVIMLYQIGELFQSLAIRHSRNSISSLMDIKPTYANQEVHGQLLQVDPHTLKIGDEIVVLPGEKVPVDGIVMHGSSMLDTKALTGESLPKFCQKGSSVISGTINITSILRLRVSKTFSNSTVSKILELVESAGNKKSKSEKFITRFATYYTPIVVLTAFFLAIVPPTILPNTHYPIWLHRALIFLVISCPCALVISVPLCFFGGIGGASRAGILIKGSNYLETLAKTEVIVFDKTGTLTKGALGLKKIVAFGISKEQLLEYATLAEYYSRHPISDALRNSCNSRINSNRITYSCEIPGRGMKAHIDGHHVLVGNEQFLRSTRNFKPVTIPTGTIIYLSIDHHYVGYLILEDKLKQDAKKTITRLRKYGIKRIVMLTGDQKDIGAYYGKVLGIKVVYSELLPADKVSKVEQLLHMKSSHGSLTFVGDGMNDAPVLSRADVGIAMGQIGSDAAIEAADVVLMTDEPSKILTAIKIAKKTLKLVHQNIIFALSIKFLVLLLGALGFTNMWEAVFADVGVSIIAILNAMRTLHISSTED